MPLGLLCCIDTVSSWVFSGFEIAPFATRKDRGRGGGKSVFLGVAGFEGGGAGLVDFVIFFRVILLRRAAGDPPARRNDLTGRQRSPLRNVPLSFHMARCNGITESL